jgi:ribokinase
VGSVNVDQIFNVAALPRPGQTVLADSTRSVPGGKGANQAVAAARAGAQVQLVAAVGTDSAAGELRAHLARNDVGLDGVVSLPGSSGAAMIVVDAAGENTIVVAPGANGRLTVDTAELRAIVTDSDVLLLQLEIPVLTALAAARTARLAGVTVIVNASPAGADPAALAELAASADVVVVNQAEADHWQLPVPHLVVTHGADGATYTGADEQFAVPSPAVDAVDTTGAGDVFAGVLAANWAGGPQARPMSPAERLSALRRACAAGALATLIPGAGDCAPHQAAVDDAVMRHHRT